MRDEPCFVGGAVTVGIFRCAPGEARFTDSGPAEHHSFVFPRTSVWIQHAGQPAFVADPHVVTFYNPGQEYRRRAIDRRGDACEWFAVRPDVLREMTSAVNPRAGDREVCGFRASHGLSDDQTYIEQRQVFRHVTADERPDPVLVEETMLRVLWRLLCRAEGLAPATPPAARSARELTESVRSVLARSFRERLTLGELGRAVDGSVFHLCRAFRAETGTTIHAYLTRLRLRSSLEPLLDNHRSITEIALTHGFSSHSHYTRVFHELMGLTPRAAREAPRRLRPLPLSAEAPDQGKPVAKG
jgi:AraC-like DNA-binding protein